MESSASKCNRALPSAIEPICFGAQLRERYTLKSDIYQLSVLIAGPFFRSLPRGYLLSDEKRSLIHHFKAELTYSAALP